MHATNTINYLFESYINTHAFFLSIISSGYGLVAGELLGDEQEPGGQSERKSAVILSDEKPHAGCNGKPRSGNRKEYY